MTDPFSVAAGTAGFISLGLEVCKGLINYCRAWKNHDSDIEDDLAKVSHLELTFKGLQDRLSVVESIDDSTSENLQAVRAQIKSCTTALNTLNLALVESEPISQPSGILDKVHNVRIRSVHLFNKEKLRDLRRAVAVSQNGLSSAIQMLNLYLATEARLALDFLTANSKAQADQMPNMIETAVIRQFELYGHKHSTMRIDVQNASSQQSQAMQLLVRLFFACALKRKRKYENLSPQFPESEYLRSSVGHSTKPEPHSLSQRTRMQNAILETKFETKLETSTFATLHLSPILYSYPTECLATVQALWRTSLRRLRCGSDRRYRCSP